jgi:ABC-type sulfate/molybdate transport systems ATPase subunit
VLLDEAWKSMSNDEKLDAVAKFLKEITDATGRQVIFATHKQDVFGKVASRILKVSKHDGVAKVDTVQANLEDEDYDDGF